MKKIVLFGNCQSEQLFRLLSLLLSQAEFDIENYSNNIRTGNKRPSQEILAAVRAADYLIYQPLSEKHGELSEENILKEISGGCTHVSFPYIFNSGVYSLCHAPRASTHGYGMIYGEEVIIDLIESGMGKEEIIDNYKNGQIDFDLKNRFSVSLEEMRRREAPLDIKLIDFIEKNYREQKLFITHNHPSNFLLFEIIRQLADLTPLPIDINAFRRIIVPDLVETNCPISPYDVQVHGYQFKHHTNWAKKGTKLINLIIDSYHFEKENPGKILESGVNISEVYKHTSRKIIARINRLLK